MKKLYKFIFTLMTFILIEINGKALTYGGCEYSYISKLKKLINNINISYSYKIIDNSAYFNITLNNIPEDVYFEDSTQNKKYTYLDTNNGEITIENYNDIKDGRFTFYVNNEICNGIKLGTKFYKFPIYNTRVNDELCKDIPNYSLCKKWLTKYYSNSEFESNIVEYKNSLTDKEKTELKIKYKKDIFSTIVEFYIKYYYYFLPGIIVVFGIIIIVSNRKGRFKL